ncbi:hypothetical protein DYB25_003168 [Aphanomyces astaci]|uniref:Inositol polyphosphate-related phosphatase domain-containing protein n=1 Tax=Aphanomyces astaci TaxID=112090 RepID=A0A397ACW5_APHAT|nr:hypothetical protein DYB25_003168 [Aphanomyces astaci]
MQKMRMHRVPSDYATPKASTSMYPPTSASSRTSNGSTHGQVGGGGLYHSAITVGGQRGSNTNLYAQGITSPRCVGGGYLSQRGSSQDLYQAGGSSAGTPSSSSGGGRDLIAAAAAASQKNRQIRGRPGSGSPLATHVAFNDHPGYYKAASDSTMMRKNSSWSSMDSLDLSRTIQYEDPASTIRLPRPTPSQPAPPLMSTFQSPFLEQLNFDGLDEDDSSSIGYMEDYEHSATSINGGGITDCPGGFDDDDEEDDEDTRSDSSSLGAHADTAPSVPYLLHGHRSVPTAFPDDGRRVTSPSSIGRQHHTGQYMASSSPPNYHIPHQPRHHSSSVPPRSFLPLPAHHNIQHQQPPPPPLPSSSPPVPASSSMASTTTPGRKAHIHAHADSSKYEYSSSGTRQEGDISIWIGTWNLGAADPFSDSRGLMDDADTSRMVRHLVPVGYDLYVLGVQEGVNENVYFAIQAYLNRNPQLLRYQRKELRNDKVVLPNKQAPTDAVFDAVRGRGDGAFMGTKFTGMAVFCGDHVAADVQVLRAGLHKFNIASGSKGGVAVALKIKHSTLCLINCHLDARNDTYRRDQIRLLNTNLGKVMGHPYFDLTQQFHHVVWMGDLNYRIVKMDATEVCRLLTEDRIEELHDRGDGLLNDRKQGIFEGFKEPDKFHNFYPTYKKFPLRGHVDMDDPRWPERVYRVLYKEPFYKGNVDGTILYRCI